ncbi:MAG: aspartate/glutamate racemase family protein, partial [Tolypothrix sp. T3-bin4]|nr:aspartate/glutamate racemase family protein [Tolypothrix sp. T3-bin4]
MKTIGLIGGLSWESSIEYYRIINETVKDKLGGLHSAKIVMYSFDFEEVKEMQHQRKWNEATQAMIAAAKRLEKAEADCVVICSNTMHKMAEAVQAAIGIPLLHIADTTANKIKHQELKTVGLLATRFTMEEEFYKGRLIEKHGLEVITPEAEERQIIHKIIYEELCLGKIFHNSKERYKKIISNLVCRGAEGIILGCTE